MRDSITPSKDVKITSASAIIPFGPTDLNATLGRFNNCTHGGPLDICTICAVLKCDVNAHLNSAWVEENPRFSAFRFEIGTKNYLAVSIRRAPQPHAVSSLTHVHARIRAAPLCR